MPVTKPTVLPRYGTTGVVVTPPSGKQDVGYVENEKPPAQYLNWLALNTYKWLEWLQDINNQAFTWTAAQAFAGASFSELVAMLTLTITSTLTVNTIVFDGTVANSVELVNVPDVTVTTGIGYRLLLYVPGIGLRLYLGSNGGVTSFVFTVNAYWDSSSGGNWKGSTGAALYDLSATQFVFRKFDSVSGGVITFRTRLTLTLSSGAIAQAFTNTGSTPGGATHYAPIGRAAIAAGTSSTTISNALCGAQSTVNIAIEGSTFDATATRYQVAVSAGSFTVYTNANATGVVVFRYYIHSDNGVSATTT